MAAMMRLPSSSQAATQQSAHEVVIRGGDDFRAKFARGREIFFQLCPGELRQFTWAVHMHSKPAATQPVRHAARPANERFGKWPRPDGHEQAMVGFPSAGAGLLLAKYPRIHADVIGNEGVGPVRAER